MDQGRFKKLATRVEETLTVDIVYADPKQLDPNIVLVDLHNRLGAAPNVLHIHKGILYSFLKNSYDRTRPAIGICIEYTSEQGIKRLLEHNMRFTKGSKFLPPILEGLKVPLYGSLACTHLNISFRILKNGTPSPVGDLSHLLDQPNLKEVAINGHRWWVLKESVPKERLMDISLWRNQDQNENQGAHEIEILMTIKSSAEQFLKSGKETVTLGDLVASASRKNPAKIQITTWQTLSRFYIGFLENGVVELMDELSEFHSENVDPREVSVSMAFYQLLHSEEGLKKCPQVRHYLLLCQYTKDKLKASSGGGPGVSQFLEATQITSFLKKPDQVAALEKTIRDLKSKYLPFFGSCFGGPNCSPGVCCVHGLGH